MKRTSLIRLGGLAAMVGGALGVFWAPQTLLWHYVGAVFWLGTLAAIAAIAGLAVLEGERWKLPWMLVVSVAAFVSIALIALVGLLGVALPYLLGLLVGTVSLLALGILVIVSGVLPWWGGAALIAGSPLMWEFLGSPTIVAWAVVGYAIFRMGGRLLEQPSRVR